MSEEEIREFLDATGLDERQKRAIEVAVDKNHVYHSAIERKQVFEAGKANFNALALLKRQAIFMPDELIQAFEDNIAILEQRRCSVIWNPITAREPN